MIFKELAIGKGFIFLKDGVPCEPQTLFVKKTATTAVGPEPIEEISVNPDVLVREM